MTASRNRATVTQPIRIVRADRNGRAAAGFWLGVLGLLVGWFPVLGLLVTVPAWVLSRAGRARFRRGLAGAPGRSGAGLVLGVVGSVICLLTTTIGIIGAANAPQRPAPVTEVSAASAPAAPVLLAVPDVVGLGDPAAREALRAAGFTEVVLGPASAPIEGSAPGTVTAQSPAGAALAAAGTVITLTEAGAPALVPTQPAAPLIAGAGVDAGVDADVDADVDVDRPSVPARPLVAAPPAPRAATPAPRPRPAPAPKPAPQGETPSSGGAAYYANCAAARSAGAAPISAGQPGYRPALDRNDDGVACE